MREIKFDVILWAEGDPSSIEHYTLQEAIGEDFVGFKDGAMIPQDGSIIIREFTGLKDSNGKEIYEGDILENGSNYENDPKLITVVWNERDGAFNGKVGVDMLPLSCAHWFYGNCEIIGNIYENPELIK